MASCPKLGSWVERHGNSTFGTRKLRSPFIWFYRKHVLLLIPIGRNCRRSGPLAHIVRASSAEIIEYTIIKWLICHRRLCITSQLSRSVDLWQGTQDRLKRAVSWNSSKFKQWNYYNDTECNIKITTQNDKRRNK